ncbi:MAG: hypothetical protein ACOZAJ_04385 [Patescibacteria group bacterium]
MENDYKKLLNYLPPVNQPEGLFTLVMSGITRRRRQRLIWQTAGWSVSFFVSLSALWWVGPATWQQLSSSGLWQFSSLLFSDFSLVTQYWQSFVWSMLESLPAFSLSITLALLWLSISLIGRLSQDLKMLLTNNLYGLE